MKPNFLVIGAAKAATTSLCQLLGEHPEVFMCDPKEPRFFSHDEVYARGWDWYESLFVGAANCTAIGEGTPANSMLGIYPEALNRIVRHLPDARIIYIVRHPIKRIESGWMQTRYSAKPGTFASFDQYVRESPNALDQSLYWKQISAYREHFPDDRIMVLFFEDFAADAPQVLRRCFEFLGVDPGRTISDAGTPRNTTQSHFEDRWFMERIRHLPILSQVLRAIPKPVGRLLQPAFRRRFKGRPQWNPQTKQWFVDQVSDDVRMFQSFYRKSQDFWKLEECETDSIGPMERSPSLVGSVIRFPIVALRRLRRALQTPSARRHSLVGKPHLWEMKRSFQFQFLTNIGLKTDQYLLDVGCGTLRGGIPLIEYMQEGHYFGIEKRLEVLEEGRKELREFGLEFKKPTLIQSDDLSAVRLDERFDIMWAFSVLIHLHDGALEECLALVHRHLKDDGCFYGNVKIGDGEEGLWQSFPVVWRPLEFYQDAAARHGLVADIIGTLDSFGHKTGIASQDTQQMLRLRQDGSGQVP